MRPVASRNSLFYISIHHSHGGELCELVVTTGSLLHTVSLSHLPGRVVQQAFILDHFKFLPFWRRVKISSPAPSGSSFRSYYILKQPSSQQRQRGFCVEPRHAGERWWHTGFVTDLFGIKTSHEPDSWTIWAPFEATAADVSVLSSKVLVTALMEVLAITHSQYKHTFLQHKQNCVCLELCSEDGDNIRSQWMFYMLWHMVTYLFYQWSLCGLTWSDTGMYVIRAGEFHI